MRSSFGGCSPCFSVGFARILQFNSSSIVCCNRLQALIGFAYSWFVPGCGGSRRGLSAKRGRLKVKLSRKDIKQALESVPMDIVLLGAAGATGEIKLSAKDREFARAIAMGESKAGAYRKSRPGSKAKPETQSRRGQDLAKRSAVQAQAEAFKAAIEAQRYQTPQHLRALVIHQLTQAALNPDFPPATRVQALKALGTVTEVAAFTERREVVKVTNAEDAKAKLLATIRLAMQANAVDIQADDLMAELSPAQNADAETPPAPDPPRAHADAGNTTYSIPHIDSQDDFDPPTPSFSSQDDCNDVTENTPPIENGSPQKDGV